ncbi:MAG: serine/threonine-protein phosphatase [Gammaproteobacteria bacterium]|nr:serine/threonine-protein phosphatase [Gammaproteobacteria bacterium]
MPVAAEPLAAHQVDTVTTRPSRAGRVAAGQSRGARDDQEDIYGLLAADDAAAGMPLLVLADGMGGHAGGTTASNVAVQAAVDAWRNSTGTTLERLHQVLAAANAAIAGAIARDERLAGSGATFVTVAIGTNGAHWISVGDSPLWLVRDGWLQRLNADHSMVPVFAALVAEGAMSAADARTDPKRHILRSALTGGPIKLIDASAVPLRAGDRLLLASDGLLSLGEDRIAAILDGPAAVTAELAVPALLQAIEQCAAPNQDNTTILLFAPED